MGLYSSGKVAVSTVNKKSLVQGAVGVPRFLLGRPQLTDRYRHGVCGRARWSVSLRVPPGPCHVVLVYEQKTVPRTVETGRDTSDGSQREVREGLGMQQTPTATGG